MRFSVLSRHLPDPEGSAAGRILAATCEGLLQEGHEVAVCSWGPDAPTFTLPSWCEWRRVDAPTGAFRKVRTLLRPRGDALRAGWTPDSNAIAVADDPLSFAGVDGHPRSVVTLHYLTKLDSVAVGRRTASNVQDIRAEARAAKRARAVLAYSLRLVDVLPPGATFVPIAYPIPAEPLPFVEAPVAAVLADWRWRPNRVALNWLLEQWPRVRERISSAELLLAGRGLDGIASSGGVSVLGFVPSSRDVLARAAALAFPVPPSSGPKVKVLEAVASGLPVVTTPVGVEGLVLGENAGAVVTDRDRFAEDLAALLADPERRRRLGAEGRRAALESHAPRAAARTRVAAIERALGRS